MFTRLDASNGARILKIVNKVGNSSPFLRHIELEIT